jgi:hypothetical protein
MISHYSTNSIRGYYAPFLWLRKYILMQMAQFDQRQWLLPYSWMCLTLMTMDLKNNAGFRPLFRYLFFQKGKECNV